jgi:hypothetical protein
MSVLTLVIYKDDIEVTKVCARLDGERFGECYMIDPTKTDGEIRTIIVDDLEAKGFVIDEE